MEVVERVATNLARKDWPGGDFIDEDCGRRSDAEDLTGQRPSRLETVWRRIYACERRIRLSWKKTA
jgi:hypothetical protein